MVNEVDIEGFNDDSGFLSDSTPLKKKRPAPPPPPAAPSNRRRTVKRRLFDDVSSTKRLKRSDVKFKFESEVRITVEAASGDKLMKIRSSQLSSTVAE